MARIPFANRNKHDPNKIENRKNLHKLYVFITIVEYHQSDQVVKLFESVGSAASFIQVGQGTSKSKVYDILGIIDDKKGVIISIVREDKKDEALYILNEYLTEDSEKNKGISFTIPLSSMIGARVYYFLTNSY